MRFSITCVSAAALLAGGCAHFNAPPAVAVLPAGIPSMAPHAAAPARPVNGSLYHAASYRPGFEDPRARFVGDQITIQITENLSASQKSSANVGRKPSISGGISVLPFIGDKVADKTRIGAEYSNQFEGGGNTENHNQFRSNITAIVTEVLPNGHLVITGEKQIGVNRSVDVLQFSGVVDPRHLSRERGHTGSFIQSRYVANVRVLSRGLGEQAEAQAMGWLARAFNQFSPF